MEDLIRLQRALAYATLRASTMTNIPQWPWIHIPITRRNSLPCYRHSPVRTEPLKSKHFCPPRIPQDMPEQSAQRERMLSKRAIGLWYSFQTPGNTYPYAVRGIGVPVTVTSEVGVVRASSGEVDVMLASAIEAILAIDESLEAENMDESLAAPQNGAPQSGGLSRLATASWTKLVRRRRMTWLTSILKMSVMRVLVRCC